MFKLENLPKYSYPMAERLEVPSSPASVSVVVIQRYIDDEELVYLRKKFDVDRRLLREYLNKDDAFDEYGGFYRGTASLRADWKYRLALMEIDAGNDVEARELLLWLSNNVQMDMIPIH
jgi:hypothetical protein